METRESTQMFIDCNAPDNFFELEWDDITDDNQALIVKHGALGCEGSGDKGVWCDDCFWGTIEYD